MSGLPGLRADERRVLIEALAEYAQTESEAACEYESEGLISDAEELDRRASIAVRLKDRLIGG